VRLVCAVAASWLTAKLGFPAKSLLLTLIELPIAVSPPFRGSLTDMEHLRRLMKPKGEQRHMPTSKYTESLEIRDSVASESAVRPGTRTPVCCGATERERSAAQSTAGRSRKPALLDRISGSSRKLGILPRAAALLVLLVSCGFPGAAQDNATTQNGTTGLNGSWINGPASNPLSFLNGPAARTTASDAPYLLPDFRPASQLNGELPPWLQFGLEERLRFEGYAIAIAVSSRATTTATC